MSFLRRFQRWVKPETLDPTEPPDPEAPPESADPSDKPDSAAAGEREQARRWRELRCHYLAAEASGRAGDWQQAARSYHQSGAFAEASSSWERWLESTEPRVLGEEQTAPVLAEIALCYDRLGETRRAGSLYRQALEILDSAAVRHEEARRYQQARSAYLAIAHIGHSKGAYESIACGLAGAIRVSKRSGRTEARLLGYYDDFIHYSARFGEHVAAAELCIEAAEMVAVQGGARAYLMRAADSWLRNGDFLQVHLERPELAEASYHAAIECFLRARETVELAACYQRLAAVTEGARRDEFSGMARTLAGVTGTGRPSSSRRDLEPEALLDISVADPPEEAQKAYFRKIRRHPPDTDFERFDALSQAYDVLSDARKRKRHAELFGKSEA